MFGAEKKSKNSAEGGAVMFNKVDRKVRGKECKKWLSHDDWKNDDSN